MDKNFIWLIFANLLFIAGCVSNVKEPIVISEPYKELVEFKKLSTEGMTCEYDLQCKAIPYGYNSCNNFENHAAGYIVY